MSSTFNMVFNMQLIQDICAVYPVEKLLSPGGPTHQERRLQGGDDRQCRRRRRGRRRAVFGKEMPATAGR